MRYEEIKFNLEGIIQVNSPEGVLKITTSDLKTTLLRIDAVNILLGQGRCVKTHIEDDEVLKEIVTKVSGEIEIVSYKLIQ